MKRGEGMTHDEDAIEPEVVATLIADVLYLLPAEKRDAALAIAVKAGRRRPPRVRRHDIMQIKARLAYTFIRTIRNNHSPAGAARLLFQYHRNAPGSGYLQQYLDDLPRDVKEASYSGC
jgi:hypothetical protein